jgi:hypothetical protein
MFTEALEFSTTVGLSELLEEQSAEQPREHAHGQEEPRRGGFGFDGFTAVSTAWRAAGVSRAGLIAG